MKDPKEKAIELIQKYNQFDFNTIVASNQIEYCKQCAIICVDEILMLFYRLTDEYEYWEQVKKEIENL